MQTVTQEEIVDFIEKNVIPVFYARKIILLNELKIRNLLKRKNPYLFGMKNFTTIENFIVELLLAHLSSQEETLMGGLLEQLAKDICKKTYGGRKAGMTGIDLDFDRDSIRYIVSVKSGPNWANRDQRKYMKDGFEAIKKTLGTNNPEKERVIFVEGCCYGRAKNIDQGGYVKLYGQRFWELISGDDEMYAKIALPITEETRRLDEQFKATYTKRLPELIEQFKSEFCIDEKINWAKIVELTSGKVAPVAPKTPRTSKRRTVTKDGNSSRKTKAKSLLLENQPTLLPHEGNVFL